MKTLTLSELTAQISETINLEFSSFFNVVAEIHQFNVNYSGHAYLQLVEKSSTTGKNIATMRAMIWANKFRMIQTYFESVTGSELGEGIKILAKVEVNFHEMYGMGLIIHDIDPTYTLGDVEKRRQEIINQLQQDGVFAMNKSLDFPRVPQRIAVISSATAAGYGDFAEHLDTNEYGYHIEYKLFKSVMQGDKAEASIISSLDKIFEEIEKFDAVVIIRGGGSKLDLSIFDSYEIASNIAQFPLPVITGIGHQRDLSIADLVAFQSHKTPTAVADFLISKFKEFDIEISNKFDFISQKIISILDNENHLLEQKYNKLKNLSVHFVHQNTSKLDLRRQNLKFKTYEFIHKQKEHLNRTNNSCNVLIKNHLHNQKQELKNKKDTLQNSTQNLLFFQKNKLKIYEAKIDMHDPQHILNMGFSITKKNGKTITSVHELAKGDIIVNQLKDGSVKSKVD